MQNFNPIKLNIKLDLEKGSDMIKCLWDECIPHEFVTFLYKEKDYEEINQPNLTYQKANNIVKEYLVENPQRIKQLKYKIEEKFNLIHYIYSSLFSKIYNRTNTFRINRKNNFDFNFQLWRRKKIQKNNLLAKNPANYENRVVKKNEQQPIDVSLDENQTILTHTNGVGITLKKNYEESFYFNKVPCLTKRDPETENNLINLIKNRDDLKKWLLATSDCGNEIQEDLNAIVGHDEKFNNAIVRHSLDLKDEAVFRNPNPLNITFHDMEKFDLVNPVIGKLATQVKASKLTDYELTKKLLMQGEIDQLQNRSYMVS